MILKKIKQANLCKVHHGIKQGITRSQTTFNYFKKATISRQFCISIKERIKMEREMRLKNIDTVMPLQGEKGMQLLLS